MIKRKIIAILEKEEKEMLFNELQVEMEKKGSIPGRPLLFLHKLRRILECTGGICLGCLIGTLAIVLNYLILVWILHVEF